MMRALKAACKIAVPCALLAACATPPPTAPPANAESLWREHSARVAAISGWQLRGRIALKSGNDGGSATLLWTRKAGGDSIELYGPFGGGRVRIEAEPGYARLQDAGGGIIEADSAADALFHHTGWRVPFDSLAQWARGLPGVGGDIDFDSAGRLRTVQRGRWMVRYQGYARVDEIILPRKLTITAAAGEAEQEMQLKVLLKSWRDIRFAAQ